MLSQFLLRELILCHKLKFSNFLIIYLCGVRYFPKGFFPRVTSKVAIFQVATSQMHNFPRGNCPKLRLGLFRHRRVQNAMGPSAARKLPLRKLHIWEVDTWKNTLGKLSLGKVPLEKYLTSTLQHDDEILWLFKLRFFI